MFEKVLTILLLLKYVCIVIKAMLMLRLSRIEKEDKNIYMALKDIIAEILITISSHGLKTIVYGIATEMYRMNN